MRINNLSSFLVQLDNNLSYLPLVSTLSNATNLFLKYVVLPRLSKEKIEKSHYYTHLTYKNPARCIILLVPMIGNILIGLYDFTNKKKGENLFKKGLSFENNNLKRAKDNYKKAAKLGNLDALYKCGIYAESRQSIKFHRRAAAEGHAESLYILAVHYAGGIIVKKDESYGLKLFKEAAAKGNTSGMYNLALFYHGGGVKKDETLKAFESYQRAASENETPAIFNLAVCYIEGLGTEKNVEKGIELLEVLCAKKGTPDSIALSNKAQSLLNNLKAS